MNLNHDIVNVGKFKIEIRDVGSSKIDDLLVMM